MELEERKRRFMAEHIGERTHEALANELFGIYLVLRSLHPEITDESPGDRWPPNLHLADVLDKRILRGRTLSA